MCVFEGKTTGKRQTLQSTTTLRLENLIGLVHSRQYDLIERGPGGTKNNNDGFGLFECPSKQ